MPRTIDSILANHRTARALRDQGKPIWSHQVAITDLREAMDQAVADGLLPEEAAANACCAIAERLKNRLPSAWFTITDEAYDSALDDLVDALEGVTVEEFSGGDRGSARDHLRFNVDALYDWADAKRVWLGQ